MEKRKVKEIADLLAVIVDFIKSGNLDNKSYEALRLTTHWSTILNFVAFLGMSETMMLGPG